MPVTTFGDDDEERRVTRTVRLIAAWLVFAVWLVLPLPGAQAAMAGTSVTGGPSINQALELTSGAYHGKLMQGREQYFLFKRQWPNSRMWHSLSVITQPGTSGFLDISASTPDGRTRCTLELGSTNPNMLPIYSVSSGYQLAPECRNTDLLLSVQFDGLADGTPYQFVLWEEPAPTNESDFFLTPGKPIWDSDMPAGDPVPVTGGADWGSAPYLPEGRYTTTVANGEVGLFRTPLTFGQHLQVMAERVPEMAGSPENEGGGIDFFNPFGGEFDGRQTRGGPLGQFTEIRGEPDAFVTPVVSWRQQRPTAGSVPALAGDYFFAFDLAGAEIPEVSTIEFSVKAVNHVKAATLMPTYPVTPPPQPSLVPVAPVVAVPADSNLVSYILFGVSGCFAVAGAVLLGRTRRARLGAGDRLA